MSSAKECLLERRRGLLAAYDAQHEPATVFDGHHCQQEDARGGAGVGGQKRER
jgi:hypothetical protein